MRQVVISLGLIDLFKPKKKKIFLTNLLDIESIAIDDTNRITNRISKDKYLVFNTRY